MEWRTLSTTTCRTRGGRASDIRYVEVARGARAVRGSIDIEGAAGVWATFDHQSVLLVRAYTIIVLGPHDAREEMAGVRDKVTSSVVVAPPAKPKDKDIAERFGEITDFSLLGLALAFVIYRRVRAWLRPSTAPQDT